MGKYTFCKFRCLLLLGKQLAIQFPMLEGAGLMIDVAAMLSVLPRPFLCLGIHGITRRDEATVHVRFSDDNYSIIHVLRNRGTT